MEKRLLAIMILLVSFFLTSAFAETVVLKTGQKLENVKIVEKTGDSIKVYSYKINEDGTDFGFVITYKIDEVENIEPDKVNRNHSVVINSIVLKSGQVVNATIVDSDQDYIKIENSEGALATYSWNDINTINGKRVDEIKSGLD